MLVELDQQNYLCLADSALGTLHVINVFSWPVVVLKKDLCWPPVGFSVTCSSGLWLVQGKSTVSKSVPWWWTLSLLLASVWLKQQSYLILVRTADLCRSLSLTPALLPCAFPRSQQLVSACVLCPSECAYRSRKCYLPSLYLSDLLRAWDMPAFEIKTCSYWV